MLAPLPHRADSRRAGVWVRRQVLEMIAHAGKGHIGGSFSCADILIALYSSVLRVDPSEPRRADRDRFIFSKGHSSEALYAVLALNGFIPPAVLSSYGDAGSVLGSHVDRNVPGIELSTGSLGHGLGVAAGIALAARLAAWRFHTFALMGDGECYEGSVWEAAMFCHQHGLGNLTAVVDRNRQITLSYTEDCNRFEPFAEKWRAFGWEVHEVDGHDHEALVSALSAARARESDRPRLIIAHTVKGKGVSFMEGNLQWHHNVPRGAQLEQARKELALAD